MIQITPNISIDEDELHYQTLYSSGPGGQHVNKTMSAVQLRFNIVQCYTLPHAVQQRLIRLGGSRVNKDYQLVITARQHRSQVRNKQEAFERLCELIRKAEKVPKPRLKRKRSYADNQNRLEQKRHRSETKATRRRVRLPRED